MALGVQRIDVVIHADSIRALRNYFGFLTTRLAQAGAKYAREEVPVGPTGNLKNTIGHRKTGPYSAAFFAAANYAQFVEYGTGMYGPNRQPIRPKSALALAWPVGRFYATYSFPIVLASRHKTVKAGTPIYIAKETKGQTAQHFMTKSVMRLQREFPTLLRKISSDFHFRQAKREAKRFSTDLAIIEATKKEPRPTPSRRF